MRNFIVAAVMCTSFLSGCTSTEQRVAGTAAVGAGTGAVIGGLAGGSRGALVGAAVGGGTGAVVGAATAPRECWARDRQGRPLRDQWGQPVKVRC